MVLLTPGRPTTCACPSTGLPADWERRGPEPDGSFVISLPASTHSLTADGLPQLRPKQGKYR